MIRYALFGWLTYFLACGALVSVFIASMWLLGLSPSNQDQSFAFIAGGAGLMIATVILAGVALIIYVTTQTGG